MKKTFVIVKKEYIYYGVACIILIVASLYIRPLEFFLRIFVKFFATGRNFIRSYMFLVYMALMFFIIFFKSGKTKEQKDKVTNFIKNIDPKLVVLILSLSLILSLISFFSFFSNAGLGSHRIQENINFDVFNENEMSSTSLLHYHTNKPLISHFLSFIGINRMATLDAGYPYKGLVSSWIYILGFPLFIISTILVIVTLWKKEELWSLVYKKGVRIGLIVIYIITSFSVLDAILDGGLLKQELGLSLPILLFLITKNPDKKLKDYLHSAFLFIITGMLIYYALLQIFIGSYFLNYVLLGILIISVILLAYKKDILFSVFVFITGIALITSRIATNRTGDSFLIGFLGLSIFYILIFLIFKLVYEKKIKFYPLAMILFILLLYNYALSPYYLGQIDTLNIIIEPGDKVYHLMEYGDIGFNYTTVAHEGDTSLVLINIEEKTNWYKLLKDMFIFPPDELILEINNKTCEDYKSFSLVGIVTILEGNFTPKENLSNKIFYKTKIQRISSLYGGPERLIFNLHGNQCIYRQHRWAVGEYFRSRGLKKFVIEYITKRSVEKVEPGLADDYETLTTTVSGFLDMLKNETIEMENGNNTETIE